MRHWSRLIVFTALISLGAISACNSTKKMANVTLDPIAGGQLYTAIYTNIFETNCFVAACHDGNFEPNFTTPQSAYYTTVMHDILKNSWDEKFKYRIVPYDTQNSLLIERITNCCFLDENDRMPVLMTPLSKGELDSIKYWINVGAPNWNGDFPYGDLMTAEGKNKKKK
jgi:hypothetical protein